MKPSGTSNGASKKWIFPGLLGLSAFLIDYFTKAWANANLVLGSTQLFIPGLLRLTLAKNTGGAWSVGRGNPLFMTILATTIVAGIAFWFWTREKSEEPPTGLERCGAALIIGGAIGNLFDRYTRGEVTDFLDFSFMQFPIFNVADSLIDVGAGLIVLSALFFSPKTRDKAETTSTSDEKQK